MPLLYSYPLWVSGCILVAAVNEVIDSHTSRAAAARDHIPSAIFRLLGLLCTVALFLEGHDGGLSDRFSRSQMYVLALILSFVLTVMIDFDRSHEGLIRLSERPLSDTIEQMESALDRSGLD
jgi:hypothetical protein